MKLAIFDFDGTLFPRDTLPFLLKQWKHRGFSRSRYYKAVLNLAALYINYKIRPASETEKEKMKIEAVKRFNNIFLGMNEEEVREFFRLAGEEINNMLFKPVKDEIAGSFKKGLHTVFLSGAYEMLLNEIGGKLNINTVLGTEIYFDEDGIYNPEKLDIVSGRTKKEKLLKYFEGEDINWAESYSYADNYSDLPILELAGNPVAVRPDDRLKKHAEEKGWRIISN